MRIAPGNHRSDEEGHVDAAAGDGHPRLRIHMLARPASAPLLRAELRSWLMRIRATEEEILDLLLAATEAFATLVKPHRSDAPCVDIEASCNHALIEIAIRDRRRPWLQQPKPKATLALTLLHALIDDVTITRDQSGTYTRLRRIRSGHP